MNRMTSINILALALLIVSCGDENPTIPRAGFSELKFRAFFANPAWHPNGKWIAADQDLNSHWFVVIFYLIGARTGKN